MLRANPETKEIPILAVTALFRSADLEACMKAGCVGYVVKPVTLDELHRKICDLLNQSQPV
jgi:two-component system, cell cycle response regulator DivK